MHRRWTSLTRIDGWIGPVASSIRNPTASGSATCPVTRYVATELYAPHLRSPKDDLGFKAQNAELGNVQWAQDEIPQALATETPVGALHQLCITCQVLVPWHDFKHDSQQSRNVLLGVATNRRWMKFR